MSVPHSTRFLQLSTKVMPCAQGHSALEHPVLGRVQPDILVLINSNNHLRGLGLGVLLPLSPPAASKCLGCSALTNSPTVKWNHARLPQPRSAPTRFPVTTNVFLYTVLHLSPFFMYTCPPLQKPETWIQSLWVGKARGSERRCLTHSLYRVAEPPSRTEEPSASPAPRALPASLLL